MKKLLQPKLLTQVILTFILTPFTLGIEEFIKATFNMEHNINDFFKITGIVLFTILWGLLFYRLYRRIIKYSKVKKDFISTLINLNKEQREYTDKSIREFKNDVEQYFVKIQGKIDFKNENGTPINSSSLLMDLLGDFDKKMEKQKSNITELEDRLRLFKDKNVHDFLEFIEAEEITNSNKN